jgi:tRNA-2-methylthio-N6-dimethylallyladenosine synthase
VEGRRDGKWHGRTRSDKLVFFQSEDEHLGELVNLNITRSSPWSLQGELTQQYVHLHP